MSAQLEFIDSEIARIRQSLADQAASPPMVTFDVFTAMRAPEIQKIQSLELVRAKFIDSSRKGEFSNAIPPGDVSKVAQTNDILKFAAIIAGLLVLSS